MQVNLFSRRRHLKQRPSFFPFNSSEDVLRKLEVYKYNPSTLQPVIISLVVGYSTRQLKPFVLSLRKFDKNCRLIIFGSKLSKSTKKFLRDNNAELFNFNPHAYGTIKIHNSRHIAILSWLLDALKNNSLPNRILMCDSKDVVFQSPPFEAPQSDMEFFLEHETPKIRDCPANSSWTRRCFGEEEIERIGHNIISCCGTIFSSGKKAIEYLILMQDHIFSFSTEVQSTICDQAIHNHILYHKLMSDITVCSNGGKVLTIGYVPQNEISIMGDKVHYGRELSLSPVLHQWDRNMLSTSMILNLYDAKPNYLEEKYIYFRNKIRKNLSLKNVKRVITRN